jgi:hypothetical protein
VVYDCTIRNVVTCPPNYRKHLVETTKTSMAFAGLCISRSGIDIVLVSAQDGALQGSASRPLELIDPIAPDADALVAPFTSLASQHPAELTVLAISTQVFVPDMYDVLPKIGLTTDGRFTIDYIGAYVAGLRADEVASAPCLLFIEITPTIFAAQLVTIRLEGTKRIRVPVHVEATTSTATTLPTFVGQVFTWAQGHNYKIFQCILLDPPVGWVYGATLQTAFAPDCPIIIVDGAQLAKYAASYALLNLEDLRQPDKGDDMGQYVVPSPISFVANNSRPTLIIHRSEPLPAVRDIMVTTSEENQTSISVEFAFGMHDARPDDRLIFAKVTLEGLHPRPVGQGRITVSVFISHDWGNMVEVFQGSERENAVVRAVVQIPCPFDGPTYDVVHPILSQICSQ